FITVNSQPHLDGGYTVFGHVSQGMEVVDGLVQGSAVIQDLAVEGAGELPPWPGTARREVPQLVAKAAAPAPPASGASGAEAPARVDKGAAEKLARERAEALRKAQERYEKDEDEKAKLARREREGKPAAPPVLASATPSPTPAAAARTPAATVAA